MFNLCIIHIIRKNFITKLLVTVTKVQKFKLLQVMTLIPWMHPAHYVVKTVSLIATQ